MMLQIFGKVQVKYAPWCNTQFPISPGVDPEQLGNYSRFPIPEGIAPSYDNFPNQFNPAPVGVFPTNGWGAGNGNANLFDDRIIDENNYDQAGVAWQIIV